MFSIQTAANNFLTSLGTLEKGLAKTNLQISSGRRVNTVSDAPDSVSSILQLNADIAANNQVKFNISSVQTETNAAESALNTATGIMDSAASIATEGSTTGASQNRAQLALQVKDLITQVQQLANTQVGGRFVFSGDTDQTPAFGNLDLTTATGVGPYQGSLVSTRSIQDAYGVNILVAHTAKDVFDGGPSGTASASVLQSLTQLYNALNNDDPTATAAAAANVKSAGNYLNNQQAIYGNIQNKLTVAQSAQTLIDTNLRAQLSALQDVDEPQAITEQQSLSTALQAAMGAYATLPKKSLFDFLG